MLSFVSGRDKPDIQKLPYQEQKPFFRFERQHDLNLVLQHAWKTKRTLIDDGRKGLLANLVRDRNNLFKKFVA